MIATLATFALFATTLTGTASGASSGRPAASVGAASSTTNIPFAGSSYGVTGSTSPFGSWTAATPYPQTIVRYAFAQSGENLYVIGGVSDGNRVNTVNRYDAITDAWTGLAPIPVASEAPCGALWNGKIYVAEGDTGNSFQIYDIATDTWSAGAPRPVSAGYGCAAGALDGKVFVIGGEAVPQTTLTVYDIATNTWSTGASAPAGVLLSGYQTVGPYLYIAGGFGASSAANSQATMRLNMSTGAWEAGPTFTPARADFGLASDGTKLYAIGGDADGNAYFDSTALVDELDTSSWPSGTWIPSPPNLPAPARQANQAGFFSTGRTGGEIWSTGGINVNTFQFLSDHLYRSLTGGPPPPPPNVDVSKGNGAQGETTAAASFTDPSNLLIGATSRFGSPRHDQGCNKQGHNCYTYTGTVFAYPTFDDGQTWGATELPPTELQPRGTTCANSSGTKGTVFAGDPFVAASRKDEGAYYYAYLSACKTSDLETSDLSVARFTNGGATWSSVVVAAGINQTFHDKPMVAVDNTPGHPTYGRVYLVWAADHLQPGPDGPCASNPRLICNPHLALMWSDDRGQTWSRGNSGSDPDQTPPARCGRCYAWAPYAVVDRFGQVSVIWYDYGSDEIRFASSTLVGPRRLPQFTSPANIGTPGFRCVPPCYPIHYNIGAQPDNGINPDPSLLIDDSQSPYAGRMYALWTKLNGGMNIVLRTRDQGRNWTDPVTVNENNPFDNFFGQEALDPTTGVLHVSFYSGTPVGCLQFCDTNNVFYARSVDGGASFTARQQVTDAPSDESSYNPYRCSVYNPNHYPDWGCFQYGDYEAIAVQHGVAHPVWTDFRRDLWTSPLIEEVYTATVP